MGDLTPANPVAAIRHELDRLGVDDTELGPDRSLGVNDELGGWVSIGASPEQRDLYWYGRADDLLERLARLPDRAGRDALTALLRSRFPGVR